MFAYPWILALGVAAAAAPVLVHWLTRPRPTRMPLSTLRFVREALQQRRSLDKLRDVFILAARTLAILLLAMAFAGPRFGSRELLTDDGEAVRVVIVDASQSMGAVVGSVDAMQRARTVAARYLQYRPGLRTNLIVAGAQPRAVFDSPSTNLEALRDELAACRPLPQRINVQQALEEAARQLAPTNEKDQRARELVIVSDFQRASWSSAVFDQLPPKTKIQMESVASETSPNVAILRAACRPQGARQDSLALEVQVGNFTNNARKLQCEATLGERVHRFEVTAPPQQATTFTEELPAGGPGWQWGEVRLIDVDDAIPADNVRPLVVELRGAPKFALVTEESPHLRGSASHILACGLDPQQAHSAGGSPVERIAPAKMDNQSLADAHFISIVRCGKLSDDNIALLASQIRRGRPVLYVAGETVDATNLDRLAKAAGVEMPVRFAPPPANSSRRDLTLASVERDAPPFAIFGETLPNVLKQFRFSGGLASQAAVTPVTAHEAILGTYNDGSAMLTLARNDAGTLAVLNADLAASNLWKTSSFVPLIEELIQRLLSTDAADDAYLCGEPLVANIPAAAAAENMKLVRTGDPKNMAPPGELTDEGAGMLWQWASPDAPGVYRVTCGRDDLFAAAIALPAEEADLTPLPAQVVKDRLAAGHEVTFHSAAESDRRDHDWWKWFVVGAVFCLLAEVGLLLHFKT